MDSEAAVAAEEEDSVVDEEEEVDSVEEEEVVEDSVADVAVPAAEAAHTAVPVVALKWSSNLTDIRVCISPVVKKIFW